MTDTLLLYDPAMIQHDPGAGHPERPARLEAIEAAIGHVSIPGTTVRAPTEATAEALRSVHADRHVERIQRLEREYAAIDSDTRVSPGSLRAARLAAGAAVSAVDAVFGGKADNAFALVRPPGHHAEPDRAMGFCLFNNVAIAAEHARRAHGAERVLVIDWDVHHGNGTQAAFYSRPDVLFFSTHQFPFYPGTGARHETGKDAGEGYTINVPLSQGATDADYELAFDQLLTPVAQRFAPDLVLVSAGFDAHARDPLGGMALSADGFARLCAATRQLCPRLVLMLEGGYDLDALAQSVVGCIRILAGDTAPELAGRPTRRGEQEVRAAVAAHADRWQLGQ